MKTALSYNIDHEVTGKGERVIIRFGNTVLDVTGTVKGRLLVDLYPYTETRTDLQCVVRVKDKIVFA